VRTSIVARPSSEVFQNCVVFNDGAFVAFTERASRPEQQLHLQHGQPMLFGRERKRGIRLRPGSVVLEAVTVGENGISMEDILVHDERNHAVAQLLVAMKPPLLPSHSAWSTVIRPRPTSWKRSPNLDLSRLPKPT